LHHICLLSTGLLHSSDHFPVFTKLSDDSIPLRPPTYHHSFSRLHSIDIDSFLSDLQSSRLVTSFPTSADLSWLSKYYSLHITRRACSRHH